MRFLYVLVALSLVLDLPATASVGMQVVAATIDERSISVRSPSASPLLADCLETVIRAPLSPRPRLKRATFAAKPHAPHRRHARPHKRVKPKSAHAKIAVHKKVATHKKLAPHKKRRHARRPARHHRAARIPLRRVTYASPLCAQRSPSLNYMLNLPDFEVTQAPVVADSTSGVGILPTFIQLPIIGGGGGPGVGPLVFPPPVIPIYPVGPGPIIVRPPTPPPPPPPPPSAVPESSSWAMMMMGMMLVGSSIRRRASKAAQSIP